jgi:hypothetical protein
MKHLTPAPPLAPAGRIVGYSYLALTVLSLVTFAVLISGWAGLTSAIKRPTVARRRRLRLLVWAPVFALLVDLVLVITQAMMRPTITATGASGGNPTISHILNYALPTVAIVGWLISVACVAVAARRAEVAPTDLRFGKSVAVVVAWLFTLYVAAYATWGIGLIVQARQSANGNFTTIAFSHSGLWLPMMVVLIATAALSVMSARAARSSWKVISATFI